MKVNEQIMSDLVKVGKARVTDEFHWFMDDKGKVRRGHVILMTLATLYELEEKEREAK